MANPKGIITRKDIIEDEALKWGEVYSENIKEAIKQNNILVDSVKTLNKQVQAFKIANSQKDYITAKQAEALATQQAIDAIKKQEVAEISADKVKRSAIATMEAERKAKQAVIDAENKAQKVKESSVKLTIEERVQNEINNKALKQEALERLGLVGAYKKLNDARTEAKNKLRDLIASESASTEELKKAQKEFENLDGKVKKADRAVGDFTKNVGNYNLAGLKNSLKDLAGSFGIAGGIGAFTAIMKGGYETIKKFEQGLADLSAITGATGKDLEYLKDQAIDLGKTTKGGAIAVVESYKLIASAKPELLENAKDLNAVTKAVLTLAKASGMEMPEAATALTDAMNQFGVDAKEASVFVDALAAGAKYGAAEIPQTTEALLKFGAVARTSNIDIHQSVALIELLAENGIKGAEAGTKLRNVLLKISAPDALPKEGFKALSEALKESGVSMDYLKDKSVPIEDKLKVLKPLLKDNANIIKIFGDENATAAINILEHNDRLRELTKSTKEQGVADEQATIRMNTLQGKTEILSSTYDSLVLSLRKGSGVVTGFFKFFVDGATGALEGLIRLNASWDELFDKAKAEGVKAGEKDFNRTLAGLKKQGQTEGEARLNIIKFVNKEEIVLVEKHNKLVNRINEIQNKINEQGLDLSFNAISRIRKRNNQKELEGLKFQLEGLRKERELAVGNKTSKASIEPIDGKTPKTPTEPIDNKEAEAKAKKAREDYLKNLKDRDKQEFELGQFRLQRAKELNQEILDDEKKSIDDRIEAFLNGNQLDLALLESNTTQKLKEISRYDDKVRDLTDSQIADLIKVSDAEKKSLYVKLKLTDDEILALEQMRVKKEDVNKKIQEGTQKLIDKEVGLIKQKTDLAIQAQEKEMNEAILAEQTKFKALSEGHQVTKDEIKKYERQISEIKQFYAKKELDTQIQSITDLLLLNKTKDKDHQISIGARAKLEEDLAKLKVLLNNEDYKSFLENEEKKKEALAKRNKAITEISASIGKTFAVLNDGFGLDSTKLDSFFQNIASNFDKIKAGGKLSFESIAESAQLAIGVISDISNSLSQSKIASIDAEIAKNDEFYKNQIELAGNDARKKESLQKESEEKRKKLEAEKRKEQYKQAVLNKTLAMVEAGMNVAKAVAAALTAGPGVGIALSIITAGLGAVQLAAIAATPIPKYKGGRKGGRSELAYVGDGGVSEVIERKSGAIEITPATDTLVKLNAGDNVHSSVDEYLRLQRASMMASIDVNGRKASNFQASQIFENAYGKEMLEELKKNTRAIEKNRSNVVVNAPKLDINHHLWKISNTNWG